MQTFSILFSFCLLHFFNSYCILNLASNSKLSKFNALNFLFGVKKLFVLAIIGKNNYVNYFKKLWILQNIFEYFSSVYLWLKHRHIINLRLRGFNGTIVINLEELHIICMLFLIQMTRVHSLRTVQLLA